MNASIGRSLRVPFFLLGCLALSFVGGRAEQASGTSQAPTPPVPTKQPPATPQARTPPVPTKQPPAMTQARTPPVPTKQPPALTDGCVPCGTLPNPNTNVTWSCASQDCTSGTPFTTTVTFTNATDFASFANQFPYLCYTENGGAQGAWACTQKSPVMGSMAYSVTFMPCKPNSSQGTGTGRIIVTNTQQPGGPGLYQANNTKALNLH